MNNFCLSPHHGTNDGAVFLKSIELLFHSLEAAGTHAVRERGVVQLCDVNFDFAPAAFAIFDLLAITANRQEARERVDTGKRGLTPLGLALAWPLNSVLV